MVDDFAGPVPGSPAKSREPVEDVRLILYACAKLSISEFPLLEG